GRSFVEYHAVVSHERGFSNNAVGTLCRWFDRGQSPVFRIAFLANSFSLRNYLVRVGGYDAFNAAQHLPGGRAGGAENRSASFCYVRLGAGAGGSDAAFRRDF